MPTASDFFQTPVSKYFRAGDFTKELVGTIQSVVRMEFKNDDGLPLRRLYSIFRICSKRSL